MGRLIYVSPMSLDGYLSRDTYDWSPPGDEGLTFITEVMRPIGTYLYGRKMYETMSVWETPELIPGDTPPMQDFARLWQAADKIVYSKSLESVSTLKTKLEREFDPQAIRNLKAQSPHDMTVGGPMLAAEAIRAGLVDEYRLFVVPRMIGRGISVLPSGVDVGLRLLEERGFGEGWVYLRYGIRG